jgi:transposase
MDDLLHSPPNWRKGEGEMIGFDLWTEIHTRARRGEAKQKMARELGVDRKTVRRLLAQERPIPYQRRVTRPALVSPPLAYIQRRVTDVDYNASRSFQELKAQGYAGGYEMVKLAVRPLRAERDRLAEATVRFETAPGRQAQVDWGSTWAYIGGQRVRVQLFVMVLGYSRRLYVECTRDQTLGSLLTCHQHAFDWCGGLTEEILYDNPKTVVLKRDWDGRVIEWHPQFWDFAHYYGFTPRLCRPYRAQTKGKVESGIKYVKRSFVMGRQFPVWDALNPMAQEWVLTVADQRLHGTIFRKPMEAFLEERLRPHHGRPPYRLYTVLCRKVATDGLVTVETNRYSVPPAYVGRTVEVHWSPGGAIQISHQGTLIATHPRAHGQHQLGLDPVHYQALRRHSPEPSAPPGPEESLALTAWTGPFPEVVIRPLACYEALISQEVDHD